LTIKFTQHSRSSLRPIGGAAQTSWAKICSSRTGSCEPIHTSRVFRHS
jgi:hypothetical protein